MCDYEDTEITCHNIDKIAQKKLYSNLILASTER